MSKGQKNARPGSFIVQYVDGKKKTSLVSNDDNIEELSPVVKLQIIKFENDEHRRPLAVFSYSVFFGGLHYLLEGRYSEMLRIHNLLEAEIDRVFKTRKPKPAFPPKHLFVNASERGGEVLWIRAEDLESYFQLLFSNTRMLKSDELHQTLDLDTHGRIVMWETSQMMENKSIRTKNAENADIRWFDVGSVLKQQVIILS
eukprot:TRINITY_DN3343_c0_g1_i1.p1 TRINITY_DN3343_c0_g1~~TRINITY_DN3343_c0_g1_i1.p1  ORF type:complete len:200 (+),score=21.77 TRINITY_DN3343_c0_g1_i1:598-1197(+)